MGPFKYRAFISYSHADEKWARWLHRSLETYGIPKRLIGQKTAMGPVPAKLAPVFRDRDELASATDLGTKLTEALEGSASLIVICSRASAKSHWVNEEVLAYKRLGRSNRVFSLIVDGEPYSTGIPGEEDQECFPPALRFQIGQDGALTQTQAEPIAADARPGKDGKANAKVKLIAGILGVGFDDLRQRELQRRNRRLAIISTSAVFGMVFAVGLATTAVIARNEAERQRARAETEAETARRTASFMIDLFAVSDPGEARGQSITAREILTKGADRIATELSDQPEIQTSLMDTIGKVYTNLGLYTDARDLLEETVDLRRALPNLPKAEFAESAYHLGRVMTEKAEYDQADKIYGEALAALEAAEPGNQQLEIDITAALADLYFRTGRIEAAQPLLEKVLGERRQLLGERDPKVADAMEELGLNLFDQGKLNEAESKIRESLALREQILGDEPHPGLAKNISNLALVRKVLGDLDEAETLFDRALAMNHRLYGDAHPEIASNIFDLADVYAAKQQTERAESAYLEALAMYRKLLGHDHHVVSIVLHNLAFLYHDSDNIPKALETSREALDIQLRLLGEKHPDTAGSMEVQGRWLTELGEYAEAETALRKALAIQLEVLEPDHWRIAENRMDLAELLINTGRAEEALEQIDLAEPQLLKTFGPDHWRTAAAKQTRGAALLELGDFAAAEPLLTGSYEQLSSDTGVRPGVLRRGLQRLVDLYQSQGKSATAQTYAAILARQSGATPLPQPGTNSL